MSRHPATRDPRTPWERHTTRRFATEHISCEPVGMVERIGEWRAGSRLVAAFLRVCKYISLVPRRPSSAKMASLHAKCFRELFFLWPLISPLPFNIAVSRRERNGNNLPRQPDLLRPSCGGRSRACEPWSLGSRGELLCSDPWGSFAPAAAAGYARSSTQWCW